MRRGLLLAICLLVAAGALLAFYELRTNGIDALKQSANELFSKGPIAAQAVAPTSIQPVVTPTVVPPSPTPSYTPASSLSPSPSSSASDNTAANIVSKIINNLLPTPTTIAPQIDIPALEKRIHDGINAKRVAAGMTPLTWDSMLNTIARLHSEDMAARDYFDHTTPEGLGPGDRFIKAGYTIKTGYAENIFMCPQVKSSLYRDGILIYSEYFSSEEIANAVIAGWMSSPGHQINILNAYLPAEGIGIAISADGKIYITEDFG